MKKISYYILIFFFIYQLFLTKDAYAQMGKQIVSPEVHKDRSITFRFNAPLALKVELNAQFLQENLPMTKGENGLWSVTTTPIEPDLYSYSFFVDNISVTDPNNVLIFPNEGFKHSLVDVQGDTPSIYSIQNVPHGKISYKFYKSSTLKDIRPLVIYTPPGYNPQGNKKYPVLYLIHGATDTHETWFKVGRVNFILDNLIAQGKAEPMIIVMPYANPFLTFSGKPNSNIISNSFDYTEELIKEILPYIEQNYSIKKNASDRAIAGFSRGGYQTIQAGFLYPDMFNYLCLFAPSVNKQYIEENFNNGKFSSPEKLKNNLKLLWLGCGTEDFLYQGVLDFSSKLDELEIPYEKMYTSGGHTWMNCRLYLNEIIQRLFK